MSVPGDVATQGFEPQVVEVDGPATEPTPDYAADGGNPPRPNDEDVRRLINNCRKARAIFTPLLGLAGWRISWVYHREPFRDVRADAAMYVCVEWPYMTADVHVSIDGCYDDDYEAVRRKVVHELAHCLVDPLTAHTAGEDDKHARNAVERLVQQIAWAVIASYDAQPESSEPTPAPLSESS